MRYRFKWRSYKTGAEGHGDWGTWTKEEADDIVRTCNREHPELHHWHEERNDAAR